MFKVFLHQLMSNAIIRLSLCAWAARLEGVKVMARAFVAAHQLHHQPKLVFKASVQIEAHYGCVNFTYRPGLVTPAMAYKNKWLKDWTQWWFYHKLDKKEYLVAMCQEYKGNRAQLWN